MVLWPLQDKDHIFLILGRSAGKESTCNARDLSLVPGSGRSTGKGIGYPLQCSWASLVAQLVKNLPAMQETCVQSLSWEGPLRRERLPTQYSSLENFMDCTVHEVTKSWTRLSNFDFHLAWRECLVRMSSRWMHFHEMTSQGHVWASNTSLSFWRSPHFDLTRVWIHFQGPCMHYADIFNNYVVPSHHSMFNKGKDIREDIQMTNRHMRRGPQSLVICAVLSRSAVSDSATRQAPLSTGLSRQEHWGGLPFPSPGGLPDPGIEPASLFVSCTGRQVLYP